MFGHDKNLKYIIYARRSSDDDRHQVKSLEDQLALATEAVKQNGFKVVKVLSESGSAKIPHNRPKFDAMVKLIESGKANAIICWHQNRLARNPLENGIIQQLLQDGKIKEILTCDRSYYPEDNALIYGVEANMSAQYSRDLSKNVKRGFHSNNKAGRFNGMAPAGYYNARSEGNRGLVLKDPERAPLIRKAFEMYMTGAYSVPEVVRALKDWGFRTRKRGKIGGRPLSCPAFYRILSNPFYMGYVRDYDDPTKLNPAQWEPLVTEDEFYRVQRLLRYNKYGGDRNLKPKIAVDAKMFELKGILRCGECGCSITGEIKHKKLKNGEIHEYIYYHCTHTKDRYRPKSEKCCQRGNVRQEELYRQIDSLLDDCTIHPLLYEWGMDIVKQIQTKEIAERNDIENMQKDSIKDLERQLENLLDLSIKGLITNEQYKQKANKLNKAISDLKQAEQDVIEKNKNWYEVVGRTLELLKDPQKEFNATTCSGERREILDAIGYNQTLTNKIIEVELHKWVEKLVKSAKEIEKGLKRVRTEPDRIKNDPSEPSFILWRIRRDSNSRPLP